MSTDLLTSFFIFRARSIVPQRRTGRWTRFSRRERGRAVHYGGDSRARARVAAADGNEVVLPPLYAFLVLLAIIRRYQLE